MRALGTAFCFVLVVSLAPAAAKAATSTPVPADIVTGTDSVPHVKVFDGASLLTLQSFFAYAPSFTGGVRVASGDVNGDGTADIITATGPGGLGDVKVFDGLTIAEIASFLPYGGFTGGVFVAAGDVNGDGRADIITGTDSVPHVKVFDGATLAELRSFFAYAPAFAGGVRVAAGDVDGDGRAEIITATGPGAAHVKVFSGATNLEMASFFAYGSFTGGVFVAAGDVNGDGRADIITGTDSVPHVKVFDGATLAELRSFFAYAPAFQGGVRVAAGDVTGDGRADILTATGPGAPVNVKVFDGVSNAEVRSFLPYGSFADGGFVAARANAPRQPTDSDGDGIPDSQDPDTVGAVVAKLPNDAFSARGHRTSTLARLEAAQKMILAGATADAIQQLGNLLMRFDGCPSDPSLDGPADKDDWVIDCDAQRAVAVSLRGVIDALAEDH